MKKFLIIIACGLFIGNMSYGQTATKFGYINSAELLAAMPEAKKADTAITQYAKSFQDEMDQMQKDLQDKYQSYQANEKTMTDAIKEVKQKEIEDLNNRMQQFQASAQQKIAQKKQDILTPVIDKAQKAIKEVAVEKGYDYIFDSSQGALLYQKQSDDIMPLVKAKLGLK